MKPELRVDLESAPSKILEIDALPGQETWPGAPPYSVENVFEFKRRQFARKEQSDFGWDWGPGFAPAGIWQKAWLLQLEPDEIMVPNSAFDLYRVGQLNNLPPSQSADWVFNASIDALNPIPEGAVMRYRIAESTGGRLVSSGSLSQVNNSGDVITGATTLKAEGFKLWWPNSMGEQALYNITVDVATSSGNVVATVTKRMGFRTIVLNMGEVTAEEVALGVAPGNHCESQYTAERTRRCILRK